LTRQLRHGKICVCRKSIGFLCKNGGVLPNLSEIGGSRLARKGGAFSLLFPNSMNIYYFALLTVCFFLLFFFLIHYLPKAILYLGKIFNLLKKYL